MITIRLPSEDSRIDSLTTIYGLQEISENKFQKQTHILSHSLSCINFIFTNQPKFFLESGVHTHQHSHCHHQFINCKFDFKVEHPSHYQ